MTNAEVFYCYFGDLAQAPKLPQGSAFLPVKLGPMFASWEAEEWNSVLAQAKNRPIMLLHHLVTLPEAFEARMLKCAEPVSAVVPLSDSDPSIMPWVAGQQPEIEDAFAIDHAVYCLSDRLRLNTAPVPTPVALIQSTQPEHLENHSSLAALLDTFSQQHQLLLCDHAFVSAPDELRRSDTDPDRDQALSRPLALAGLQARIQLANGWPTSGPGPGVDERPVRLIITHDWEGGVEQWCRDLAQASDDVHNLFFRAQGNTADNEHTQQLALFHADALNAPLREYALQRPIQFVEANNHDYNKALQAVIHDYCVSEVVVASLIGHTVQALTTGLPTVMVLHDYTLFYDRLIAADGANILPSGDNPYLDVLGAADNERGEHLLKAWLQATSENDVHLVVPDASVASNSKDLVPELTDRHIEVIPHGIRLFAETETTVSLALPNDKPRLLVAGRLWREKGGPDVFKALPALSKRWHLVLLGAGPKDERVAKLPGVSWIEHYKRDDLPAFVRLIDPQLTWLPSKIAETFGYLLSELQLLGQPVVAANRGSYRNRIDPERTGFLYPADDDPAAAILALNDEQIEKAKTNLKDYRVQDLSTMARQYRKLLGSQVVPSDRYPLFDIDARSMQQAAQASAWGQSRHTAAKYLRLAKKQSAEMARERDKVDQVLKQQQNTLQECREKFDSEMGRVRTEWEQERKVFSESSERLQRTLNEERDIAKQQYKMTQDTLMKERSRMQKTYTQMQEEMANERQNANREITRLVHSLEALRTELEDANIQRDEFARQSIEYKNKYNPLVVKADWIYEQWQHSQQQLEQMHQSRWWRFGAPLRSASAWSRRQLMNSKFQARRIAGLAKRTKASFANRGAKRTAELIVERLGFRKPPAPAAIAVQPLPTEIKPFALPKIGQPTLSVVIPVHNKYHYTYACLQSLLEHWPQAATEIIVVDDASSDETPDVLAKIENLRVVRLDVNAGFVGACRAGADAGKGDYVLFLNNDTTLTPGWADTLLATYSERPDVGLVGSKLVYPDGRLQEAGGLIFSDGSGWNYGKFQNPDDPKFNYLRKADYCSGASILLEKSFYDEMGGFNQIYAPAYYEDTDLAFNTRAHGRAVYYQPASVVVHHEGITAGTDTSSGMKKYQVINQATFLDRWKEPLRKQVASGGNVDVAKDRETRGVILIVDAVIPMPDQDSGSVRMRALMSLLVELGYKVVFCPANGWAGEPYRNDLQQLGVEVQYTPFYQPVKFFEQRGAEFQAIIVSRHYVANDYLPLIQQYAPQAKLVFDTVDLHYLRESREAELAGRNNDPAVMATRKSELAVIDAADVTLVVSPVEKKLLASDAPGEEVEILSNIHSLHETGPNFEQRADLAFVGSYQHTPNVDAVKWFVTEVWPLIRKKLPQANFRMVGSKMPDELKALEGNGVQAVGFVETLDDTFHEIRLSVAPLRYGAGVKGKVNTSMAYGVPVVASSVAAEGMDLEDGRDVLIADDPQVFADAVVRVYEDSTLWQKIADNGVANIERNFSREAAKQTLERIVAPLA